MKKQTPLIVLLIAAGVLNSSYKATPENQTRNVVMKMVKSIEAYKGCTYTMRGNERIIGIKGLRGGDIFTKVNVSPYKVYMKMVTDPNKDTEVLYGKGERSDKALVNPAGFVPTVKLSPFNTLLTKDQRHTLLSAGFGLVAKIVNSGIQKADAEKKFDSVFKYVGDVTWNNRACHKLVIEDPTWGYTTYKAQKGETMYTIAQKLLISEYSIVELNGIKEDFEADLGGKALKVPTSYAKKTVFYIDKANNFPIFQEMQDDRGVFERYEFFNLVVNPAFKADEFTEDFPGYNL